MSWYAAFMASTLQLGASCRLPAAAVSLPLEKDPRVRWVGGCVNPKAGLVALRYGENLLTQLVMALGFFSHQPVV